MILELALFSAAAFAAALVAGLAGFAFGLVAAALWLHLLTPAQSTALIVLYGLIVQGWAVWKLRRALRWKRLLPFLIGGQLGIPLGVELLRHVPVEAMRVGIGVFLVAFALYSLARPKLAPVAGERPMGDGAVGFLSGVVGGATGFAGILATIWATLRGWPKDEQRAVFQPTGVAIFLGTAVWLGGTGTIDRATIELFFIGLPALLLGTWAGLKLYGRLDEAGFRKVVLIVLLASGAALVAPRFF